mgnify:CR=1 FL=1|jgi:hypothetical protein
MDLMQTQVDTTVDHHTPVMILAPEIPHSRTANRSVLKTLGAPVGKPSERI